MKLKVHLFFAWYDFWVGLFYDRAKRILYFFPLPMIGFKFWLSERGPSCAQCGREMKKCCYNTGDGWSLFWDCADHPGEDDSKYIEWPWPGVTSMTNSEMAEAGFTEV